MLPCPGYMANRDVLWKNVNKNFAHLQKKRDLNCLKHTIRIEDLRNLTHTLYIEGKKDRGKDT